MSVLEMRSWRDEQTDTEEKRKVVQMAYTLEDGSRFDGEVMIPVRVEGMIQPTEFPCVMIYFGEALSKQNKSYYDCKITNKRSEDVVKDANKLRSYSDEELQRLFKPVSLATFPAGSVLVCSNMEKTQIDGNYIAVVDYECEIDDQNKVGKVFIPVRKLGKVTSETNFVVKYNGTQRSQLGRDYHNIDVISDISMINAKARNEMKV